MEVVFGLLAAVLSAALAVVMRRWWSLRREHEALRGRFSGVLDADAERRRVLDGIDGERRTAQAAFDRERLGWEQALRTVHDQHQRFEAEAASVRSQAVSELATLNASIAAVRAEFASLDEESNLRSFGFYKPRYDFASSERYQRRLEEGRELQKAMIKAKIAAVGHGAWTVNGSAAEGRKQINQTLKLMLRAFNGESDAAIAKVKYNNIHVMETRIENAKEAIDALAVVQQCTIAPEYLGLKLEELRLVHEYQEKLQAEKEEQRRIRDQIRDEEAAEREMERARQEAEKEERRYAEALAKARDEAERAVGAKQAKLLDQITELERRFQEAQQNVRAISQAQLTRTGHVYIISNVGSFGEHVYKIGMTRRLNPHERVDELGAASVPFDFDVHAMIRASDAPALETALHHAFHERRVNLVNLRKEFFRVTLDEIATAATRLHGDVEFTLMAEAEEYRKTVAMVAAGVLPAPPRTPLGETPAPARVTARA